MAPVFIFFCFFSYISTKGVRQVIVSALLPTQIRTEMMPLEETFLYSLFLYKEMLKKASNTEALLQNYIC